MLGLGLSGTAKYLNFAGKQVYWYGGNPAQALSFSITAIGGAITVFSLVLEYKSIFETDNRNTNGDRVIKCLIETGGTIIVVSSISITSSIIGAAIVAGTVISTPVIIAIGAVIGVALIVEYGLEWIYKKIGIE